MTYVCNSANHDYCGFSPFAFRLDFRLQFVMYCFLASKWGNFGWRLLSLCVTMGESHFTFIISYFLVLIISCLDLFLVLRPNFTLHSTVLTVFRWQFLSRMFWCRIGTFWLIFSQPFNTFVIFHQFTIKKAIFNDF